MRCTYTLRRGCTTVSGENDEGLAISNDYDGLVEMPFHADGFHEVGLEHFFPL